GYVRAELKPTFNGDSSSDTISLTVRNQKSQRFSAFAVCRYKIPASARGTNVQIGLRAAVKVGAAGAFQLDS
ncbi:hypothetical protein, partial [Salmonella enterica]|uniref:hypothetical protein n=1 Tax=Salmonella enterica TaxID=28901 RepID=UPI003CFA4F61